MAYKEKGMEKNTNLSWVALVGLVQKWSYQVIFLAVDFSVDIVEGLAPEGPATRAANEAVGVVQLAHGLAGLSGTCHLLATRSAVAYKLLQRCQVVGL